METMTRTLSIIIPCYNESRTIEELLRRVEEASTPNWQKEVIVVDDASSDGTRNILKKYEQKFRVIYQAQNGGKGTAVKRGVAEATGEYLLIQDADLEYDPSDYAALLAVIDAQQADVVFGSRNLRPRERQGAYIPRMGVWFLTQLINVLYGLRLTDVWTCYKLFPRAAADSVVAGRFESELLHTAALARRGYRFVEVPIAYHPRPLNEGKKIRYRDGLVAIYAILFDYAKNLLRR